MINERSNSKNRLTTHKLVNHKHHKSQCNLTNQHRFSRPSLQARNLQKKYEVKWIWEKFYFYLVLAEQEADLRDLKEPLEDPKSK